ncbi:MAG: YIP1 family protein [Methanomicrobiaceae archaeon]|nr:YIP1 family protein [Methanomicrobiaceae archaeon]
MIPVKEILLSPGDFFDELIKKPESLKIPAVIILIYGILAGVAAAIASSASVALLPREAAFMSGILPVIGFVAAVIGTFIFILIWAGILHIISSLLKGEGGFSRTLELTAYGTIPQIFGSIITAVLMYMHFSSLSLSPVTSQADIVAVTEMMASGPLMTASAVIGIIVFLWSANIWLIGMMKCRKMQMKQAAISVGIPVAVYLIISLMALI